MTTRQETELTAAVVEPSNERKRRWPASLGVRASPEMLTLLGLLVILVVVGATTTQGFVNATNARTIIRAAALTGIVAVGLTFITLSGNLFSLSVGQTAAFCGVILALMLKAHTPVALALLAILAVAVVVGGAQGGVVALGANPIIVTLGAGALLAGVTAVITGGAGVTTGGASLGWLGQSKFLGLTMPIYAFILVAVLAAVFLARRRAGRALMMVGANRSTAAASGMKIWRTTVLAFVLCAVTCAVAAALTVAQFERADSIQFEGVTFDALAMILVGGTAIQGGDGSPARTAVGAVFVATLTNVMTLHSYSFGARLAVEGLVVVAAVTVFHVMRQRRTGR